MNLEDTVNMGFSQASTNLRLNYLMQDNKA